MIPLHWITVLFAGAAGLAFAMPWDTCIVSMIVLAASYLFLLLRGTISLSSPILGPCINRGRPADHFALTFDNSPDPEGTHAVLDLLAKYDVPATFFCIGEQVEAHPEIAQRIHDEGHLIGNHSFSHSLSLTFANPTRLASDMSRCQDVIETTTGYRPRFYRPPFGLRNYSTHAATTFNKVLVVGWCAGGMNTTKRSTGTVVKQCLSSLGPGAIMRLHDNGSIPGRTLEIVRQVLDTAKQRGLRPVRLDALI